MIRIYDFVNVARTVAEASAKYGYRMCCAGYSPTLKSLVRIYPLDIENKWTAWGNYEIEAYRHVNDARRESFRISPEYAPVPNGRTERYEAIEYLLAKHRFGSICELNRRRRSLGVLIPKRIDRVQHKKRDVEDDFGANSIEHKPYMTFLDDRKPHTLQVREVGVYEWLRKKPNRADQCWDNLQLGNSEYRHALLVGNMCNHLNVWLIISVMQIKLSKLSNEIQKLPVFHDLESQKGFSTVTRQVAV